MGIQKQEFYEGAALHILLRNTRTTTLKYDQPFFVADDRIVIYMKHSTKKRSPWGFTFTPDEQGALRRRSFKSKIWIGLVCGADGVAALDYESFTRITRHGGTAIHVACFRRHRERYEICGPKGKLKRKVPPSDWPRLLES